MLCALKLERRCMLCALSLERRCTLHALCLQCRSTLCCRCDSKQDVLDRLLDWTSRSGLLRGRRHSRRCAQRRSRLRWRGRQLVLTIFCTQ